MLLVTPDVLATFAYRIFRTHPGCVPPIADVTWDDQEDQAKPERWRCGLCPQSSKRFELLITLTYNFTGQVRLERGNWEEPSEFLHLHG